VTVTQAFTCRLTRTLVTRATAPALLAATVKGVCPVRTTWYWTALHAGAMQGLTWTLQSSARAADLPVLIVQTRSPASLVPITWSLTLANAAALTGSTKTIPTPAEYVTLLVPLVNLLRLV
jgi:hypothetical protein